MYRCILLASKYNAIALGKMSQVQHHHNFDKNGCYNNVRHAHSSKKKTKIPYYYSIIQNKDKMSQRENIYIRKNKEVIY